MDEDILSDTPASDPGDDFEESYWGLLRRRYPPEDLVYIPATMGGDCGIEGYSTDGIAYQCYADRDSLNLRHRTDKQKSKLYTDTAKLKKYAVRLEALLDGLVLDHYFLVVPQYHAAELVEYAGTRAAAVRAMGLPFIGSDFAIRIKTPQDYPAELKQALHDGSSRALVAVPDIAEESVDAFPSGKPALVETLDSKLSVLLSQSAGIDGPGLRAHLIRAFLAKEQVMAGLREWPDTWEAVERRRRVRQEKLEMESLLSPEAPDHRMMTLISDYETDLRDHIRAVTQEDAQRLAIGQVGEWLMRCPLRFRQS